MLMYKRENTRGFTIVELLIVVVIIAILAAITLVTYNGIQQKARNARVVAGVNTYIKALHEYNAVYSQLPSAYGCLGADYPSNQCWVGDSGTWSVSSTLDANLAEFISTKPTLATTLLSIGITNNVRAGAMWNSASKKVIYYLEGPGQPCNISGATAVTEGGVVTQCAYQF